MSLPSPLRLGAPPLKPRRHSECEARRIQCGTFLNASQARHDEGGTVPNEDAERSLKEVWNCSVMLFLHLHPLEKWTNHSGIERGGITQSRCSFVPLRVLASPKSLTAQVHFVHAQSIEPSTRVREPTLLKQKMEPLGSTFCFRRERGSNPRSCDRLRFSRPAQSTTLASLRGLGQYSNKKGFFQAKEKPCSVCCRAPFIKMLGLT